MCDFISVRPREQIKIGGKKHTDTQTHTQSVTWKNQDWLCIPLPFFTDCHVLKTVMMLPAHHLNNNTKYKSIHSFMLSKDTQRVYFLAKAP